MIRFTGVIFLINFFLFCNSQTIISQQKRVIYFNSTDADEKKILSDLAKKINCFIERYHVKDDSLMVLLDVSVGIDTSYYQIGYDNLYGSSVNNGIYHPKTNDYNILGLRIRSGKKW